MDFDEILALNWCENTKQLLRLPTTPDYVVQRVKQNSRVIEAHFPQNEYVRDPAIREIRA